MILYIYIYITINQMIIWYYMILYASNTSTFPGARFVQTCSTGLARGLYPITQTKPSVGPRSNWGTGGTEPIFEVWASIRVQNCFGNYCFSVLGFFDFLFCPLSLLFAAFLELKAAISMAFATFRSSNLGVCKVLGTPTVHVAWYFATTSRVH